MFFAFNLLLLWVLFTDLFFLFRTRKKKMGEGEQFQLGTIGALSLSVVSSVSIVICNKALMSSLHFIFGKHTYRLIDIYLFMQEVDYLFICLLMIVSVAAIFFQFMCFCI